MNLFKQFKELNPAAPLRVGTVTSIDGTEVRVLEVGGRDTLARGEAAVGDQVYLRNSVIEGKAPSLPLEIVEE